MRRVVVVLAVLVGAVAACGDEGGSGDRPVTVFAAASLAEVFDEIVAAFEDAHPAADLELVLGGSSSLREQILAGAPADVYASADTANMRRLADEGAVAEPRTFATTGLAIAVPAGNPAGITGLADLGRDEPLVGLCAPSVPCGAYALAALHDAGVDASVDTEEPDVRALLTKVEAGELDVGIVYATDLTGPTGAERVDIPGEHDVVVTYPIATVGDADRATAAAEFVAFVTGADGRAILADHGFGTP